MKTLTVRQPWAGLLARGIKDVENRSWVPTLDIGERFAIHAGRDDTDTEHWPDFDVEGTEHKLCTVHGLVIATVRLAGVDRCSDSPWALPGYWHWHVDEPRLIRSQTYTRGQVGLWEWERH